MEPTLETTEMIRKELRVLEMVIETMNCGLLAEDRNGTILYVNDRLLGWLGYERAEVVGKRAEALVPPELRDVVHDDLAAVDAGDLRARLLALQRKDSTTFPIVSVPERCVDDEGNFEGFLSIVIDMGAVLTAKQVGRPQAVDLGGTLSRIARELDAISLSVGIPGAASVPHDHPDIARFSPRESEILAYLLEGHRVPGIAEQLGISPHTVRNHLKSMYRKLGVGSQTELIERVRGLGDESPPTADAPA